MLIEAVGNRGRHDRREVATADRPVRRRLSEEREVVLAVVANRELVVRAGAQPTVAGAFVVCVASAAERVVGQRVPASLEIRRQRKRLEGGAAAVGVNQAGLLAAGLRHPAQQMVERTMGHHRDDDVVDPALPGLWELAPRIGQERRAGGESGQSRGRPVEELSATESRHEDTSPSIPLNWWSPGWTPATTGIDHAGCDTRLQCKRCALRADPVTRKRLPRVCSQRKRAAARAAPTKPR